MKYSATSTDFPFAAEGGVRAPAYEHEDPYRVLDDLMAAVEALCPVWPSRPPFVDGGRMLL